MKQTYKIGQKILVRSPVDTNYIFKDRVYEAEVINTLETIEGTQMAFRIDGGVGYATRFHSNHLNGKDWILVTPDVSLLTNITKFLRRVLHV
jgi:hypothetical protein